MGQLRFLDLELEVVTPLMMGGADQSPEVRPPSFRGGMRRWLRALIGGILGQDLDILRQVEGAVFGSSLRASPVAVRHKGDPATGRLPVDPRAFPGVQYMLWSAYATRRAAILPGERFTLRLQTRPFDLAPVPVDRYVLDPDIAFEFALASLWLLLRLGGVGMRPRRGAGGMRVTALPAGWPETLPPPVTQAATPQALVDELAQDLGWIRRFIEWPVVERLPLPTDFNILHPDACNLYVLDRTYPSWWEALDSVGQAFRAFRTRQPDDYQGIKGVLTRTKHTVKTIKRAIFGLPLPFFFSSIYKDLVDQGVPAREARARAGATVMPRRGQRRASPIVFQVIWLPGDEPRYAVLVELFRARFLPEDIMVIRPRDRSIRPVECQVPADFSYIEEWLAYLEQEVAPLLPVAYL